MSKVDKMDEAIIVVPRENLFNNEKYVFQGSLIKDLDNIKHGDTIIKNMEDNYQIMRRGNAEENLSFKQPIPYAVVRKGDKFFAYERLVGGGEARLHGKLSMGFGGHMNASLTATDFGELLTENLERELNEELSITGGEKEVEIIGLINDDLDEVGKVHIGVLSIVDLDENTVVVVNETSQIAGKWYSFQELKQSEVFDRLENWSKIVIGALE